ncbi:MAG: DUF3237 domain-containing protein [Steroidobacteraceae bacterium]
MIELEPAMIYRLDVTGPASSDDGSASNPRRVFWQMTRATLQGPNINATTLMPGIDWFTPYPGGYGRPHVRLAFRTDDGALVLLEYRGIVHATAAFTRAVERDTATQWDDQYMRMAMTFDTSAERYAWLMESLFIARGRLAGAKAIEYDVYRVR